MDIETARFLASPAGQAALDAARDARALPVHLRARAISAVGTAEAVRAALAQDDLRVRAARKVPDAERLLFEAEALEQATAWPVATERATRWPSPDDAPLVDLGAGIGLDTLATALAGRPVVAVEHDPVRAVLLAFNGVALGVADRIDVRVTDAADVAGVGGPLAFLDPARRVRGVRLDDPHRFQPPRDLWDAWLAGFAAALVKLPPAAARGIEWDEQPLEVVSLAGRARECRLFVGAGWGTLPRRRALSLPSGQAIAGEGIAWPATGSVEQGTWLLDPDPAVTLAGLVGDLAVRAGLAPVHPRIAYLVGPAPLPAPGRWFEVDAVLRARPREIDAWLRHRDIGRLTVKTRGVSDDAAAWRRRLDPRGAGAGTVVITRDARDRWFAVGSLDASEDVSLG